MSFCHRLVCLDSDEELLLRQPRKVVDAPPRPVFGGDSGTSCLLASWEVFLHVVQIPFIVPPLVSPTGNTVHVGIHPSKVQITKIKMDKDRKALLERKDRTRSGGKPAAGAADADVNMAGVD